MVVKAGDKMAEMFTNYIDKELTVAKPETAVATVIGADGKKTSYKAKRVCGYYPTTSDKNIMANKGLALVYQGLIRTAKLTKLGIKKVSSGATVNLSAIESV